MILLKFIVDIRYGNLTLQNGLKGYSDNVIEIHGFQTMHSASILWKVPKGLFKVTAIRNDVSCRKIRQIFAAQLEPVFFRKALLHFYSNILYANKSSCAQWPVLF